MHNISFISEDTNKDHLCLEQGINLLQLIKSTVSDKKFINLRTHKHLDVLFKAEAKMQYSIVCDATKIGQVVYILFDNAIKYSKNGGVITIEINTLNENNELIVKIIDDGHGVPKGEEKRIFMPFAKSSASALDCGIGFNLAMCEKIITMHGGKIWAENNVSKNGLTVSFTLPCTQKQLSQSLNNMMVRINEDVIYLSEKESQCVKELLDGKSMKEVASVLNISVRTVEVHIHNIKAKLKIHRKSELITLLKYHSNLSKETV